MGSPITPPSEPLPNSVDLRASRVGLRAVATLEAAKGLLVVVLLVLLLAVHHRIEDYAEDLLYHLHIDFDRQFAQRFLRDASQLSDTPLRTVATIAAVYAAVRFVEAWGLWNRRVWAEWFALLSGAIYLPLEVLKVVDRPTWEYVGVLAANVAIVSYMLMIRIRDSREKAKH